MSSLPAFPIRPGPAPATPAAIAARGYALRHARDEDLPQLRRLYADTRAEEMAGVPWPAVAKQGFLDQQFALQHQHYLREYAAADFLVLERAGVVQGRYYLLRGDDVHLVVDISLMAGERGQGIGRALIVASQREAAALGRGMYLHVSTANPRAQRLYAALGFVVSASTPSHHRMDWRAS